MKKYLTVLALIMASAFMWVSPANAVEPTDGDHICEVAAVYGDVTYPGYIIIGKDFAETLYAEDGDVCDGFFEKSDYDDTATFYQFEAVATCGAAGELDGLCELPFVFDVIDEDTYDDCVYTDEGHETVKKKCILGTPTHTTDSM